MSAVRVLSRVPVRVHGEAFASYVERLAAMHKVDLLVTLQAVGLIADERYETINGYGVLMSETQLERFRTATKMTREQASRMLMSTYDGTALNLSGLEPGDAQALRKRAADEWAYFSGTHVCPRCVLEDNGAWQLAWKLPWTFACIKHKCYLVPYCPGCERRFRGGRRDRRLSPVFVRHVPELGVCNNPMPIGESAGIGKAAKACRYSLADIPVQAAGRSTLTAQKQINEALASVPQSIFGTIVSPRDFFRDLRSICALVLYCAEASDLDRLPDVEQTAFSEFATKRNATHDRRKDLVSPRNGERIRTFIGPPDDPKLMAAVTRHALSIFGTINQEAMVDMMKPIAERCIARGSKRRWSVMESFRFSERVGRAFQLGLAHRSSFDRTMGNRSLPAQENRYTFEPCHVPQLIWATDYESHFSQFFPEIGTNYARRFCSMSLVKLCGHYTWGDAARLLGLPVHHGIKLANRCVGCLADEKTKQQFSRVLHTVAKNLSKRPDKIDYGQRRKAFAGLRDIPREDWLSLCRQAQITPGHPGRRSRYAATWLWSYLTDGDWTLAPALEGENTINAREVYRSISKNILVDCRSELISYGANLLANLAHRKIT
jgi:hypothetical protein